MAIGRIRLPARPDASRISAARVAAARVGTASAQLAASEEVALVAVEIRSDYDAVIDTINTRLDGIEEQLP